MHQVSPEDDIYSQKFPEGVFHHGNEFIQPLTPAEHRDLVLQRCACIIGGFTGAYAVMILTQLASAQTLNIIEFILNLCNGHLRTALLLFGGICVYAFGILLSAIINAGHGNLRRITLIVSSLVMLLYCFMPASMPMIPSLYPSFLMAPMLWIAFSVPIRGYNSACIFSSNNLRQTVYSLGSYLMDHDRRHLEKAAFFAGSLVFFHLGVAMGFVAVGLLDRKASLITLPLILYMYYLSASNA